METKQTSFNKKNIIQYILYTFSFITLGASVYFTYEVIKLNALPNKYLISYLIVLVLILAFLAFMCITKRLVIFGIILSIIFTTIFIIGSYYVSITNNAIDDVTGSDTKTDSIAIVVLKDNFATTINDTSDYTYGILSVQNRALTDDAINKTNAKLNTTLKIKEFNDWNELVNALYTKTVDAIFLNEAFIPSICEKDYYPTFKDDTRFLTTYKTTTVIDTPSKNTVTDITTDPFVVYATGIDVYGDITATSRSDVNILICVNPSSKQILLLSTPRDYYVTLPKQGNAYDKLTHAGIYGVDSSMAALSNLYNIDINHFLRVNFTGFVKIIDALGGITVNSDYEFKNPVTHDTVTVGENTLTGNGALGFVRERYTLPGGDRARGNNQMKVINAVLKKMMSSSLLTNYTNILESLANTFETSLSSADISKLIKMQLDDMSSWNIVQYSVDGTGASNTVYSSPGKLYVMIPDETTVSKAKSYINDLFEGKILVKN